MVNGGPNSRSSANPFTMDDRRWPLVHIKSPQSDVNVESFFALIDVCLKKKTMFGAVHDIRGLPPLNALQRKKFSDYISSKPALLKAYIAALGVVVNSGIERGIVTAVLWVSPVPFPVRVFGSMEEAEVWVREHLRMGPGR